MPCKVAEPLVVLWPRSVAEPRNAGLLYYKDTHSCTKKNGHSNSRSVWTASVATITREYCAAAGEEDEGEDLAQHYPTELSRMMAMFYICAVPYGSYKPYVASEHLRLV